MTNELMIPQDMVSDKDREMRWFAMPVSMQLANVGSEVNRAIRYKNKNEPDKQVRFCDKAVELLQLSKRDPKNAHRQGELDFCIEELQDFFKGDNYYQTTDDKLMRYYDAFI